MTFFRLLSRFSAVALLATVACTDEPRTPAGPATAARAPQFSLTSGTGDGTGATGRHIVSFSGSVPGDFAAQVALLGGTVVWLSPGSGLATVSGLSSSGATALAGLRGVASVDADEGIPLDIPAISEAEAADGAGVTSPTNPAGAVRYARQWNMRVVRADSAWAHGFLGSSDVSIFMLDTGIDYLHADLMGRVDLTRSVDLLGTFKVRVVVKQDTLIVPFTERDTVTKYFPTRLPFTDLFFHGTHTGATVSSNAVRAAGITSMTRLVAVKVCAYLNICPFSSILHGVIYAAENDADVINMSLGGGFSKAGNGRFVGLLQKVFNFARSKGVTIVVSAGNAAADLDHNGNTYATFCDTPAVICVSATGPLVDLSGTDPNPNKARTGPWVDVDAAAFYTNFGRSAINVAAPGGNSSFGPKLAPPASRSTFVWAACSQTSLLVRACAAAPIFILGLQGTSMSAPHVSGAAALLAAIVGRNPALIKARIQQSADEVGAPGTTPFYGKGRVNVARAVGAIP